MPRYKFSGAYLPLSLTHMTSLPYHQSPPPLIVLYGVSKPTISPHTPCLTSLPLNDTNTCPLPSRKTLRCIFVRSQLITWLESATTAPDFSLHLGRGF
jgi:hypothetical protein